MEYWSEKEEMKPLTRYLKNIYNPVQVLVRRSDIFLPTEEKQIKKRLIYYAEMSKIKLSTLCTLEYSETKGNCMATFPSKNR